MPTRRSFLRRALGCVAGLIAAPKLLAATDDNAAAKDEVGKAVEAMLQNMPWAVQGIDYASGPDHSAMTITWNEWDDQTKTFQQHTQVLRTITPPPDWSKISKPATYIDR